MWIQCVKKPFFGLTLDLNRRPLGWQTLQPLDSQSRLKVGWKLVSLTTYTADSWTEHVAGAYQPRTRAKAKTVNLGQCAKHQISHQIWPSGQVDNVGKFQWEVKHLHFMENFQLCLSFYPCPNIPDTFVGDEMNGCQSQLEFNILQRNRKHGKWKWTNKLDIWPLCCSSIKKKSEIFVKLFFQTLDAIFSY